MHAYLPYRHPLHPHDGARRGTRRRVHVMTRTQHLTWAAICGLTFACDKRALDYLLTKEER